VLFILFNKIAQVDAAFHRHYIAKRPGLLLNVA
jgi:hypothetical protein